VRNVQFKRLESGGATRHFERLFLSHRFFNSVVSETGKFVLSCLIWPRFVAPFRWQLTRYPMALAGLDPVFRGYKILQLTDLHVGKTRVDYLAQVFDRAMLERPDLIVITGDLIDYQPAALGPLRELLGHLVKSPFKPPDGIVAIFGNHDYHEYSWRHTGPRSARRAVHKRLVRIIEEAGVHLLRNQQHSIQREGARGPARFTLVGIDEMWTGLANAEDAFRGLGAADPVLCLQHNPDGVEFLKPYPWQYMLCGHSHGGQASFPIIGALYVPMEHRHYLRGFFHFPPLAGQALDHRTMFVSTGLGYSTPIRMNCPPEATLFTLEPASGPRP
jgi:predicted MPP superfamily phosphohydrolase